MHESGIPNIHGLAGRKTLWLVRVSAQALHCRDGSVWSPDFFETTMNLNDPQLLKSLAYVDGAIFPVTDPAGGKQLAAVPDMGARRDATRH